MTSPDTAVIRVVDASLGPEAHVRLVVSGSIDLQRLRSVWVSSGATVQYIQGRLHATTTVQALARAAGRAFGGEQGRELDAVLRDAISAWSDPPPALTTPVGELATDARPLTMGIVNVTPDSFAHDAPLYPDGHPTTAVEHGRRLLAEGADLIDVGGESTRPGAAPVDAEEELRRVVPVVEALVADGAVVSIDTSKAAVAAAALEAGAAIVNDVSGAQDPELLGVTAAGGAGYILMHSRGTPQTMASMATYDDVVAEVYEFLADGLTRCADAGIDRERIVVDPGIGFAKDPDHNLQLLNSLRQLRSLGRPVMIGASRKSFLGTLLEGAGPTERLEGSLACVSAAVGAGAAVLRVHDVVETVRVARVARAIVTASRDWPTGRR